MPDDRTSVYTSTLLRGPFPGRIDPWSELPRYFQQLHASLIGLLQKDLQPKLLAKGYLVGRETSLQITAGKEPDLTVQKGQPAIADPADRSGMMSVAEYTSVAAALEVETGIEILEVEELAALYIRELETQTLVTVLEIISPGNKERWSGRYRQYRALLLEQGVNFVELDLTRSVQRLLESRIIQQYAYYIGVYLPGEPPLVLGGMFDQPLRRFALPLRHEGVAIATQAFYDQAYQDTAIAGHLLAEAAYTLDRLPFPTTLTQAQREAALQQVTEWHETLQRLRDR